MEDKLKEKSVTQKFFGEYSWMYQVSAFVAFIMVIYILLCLLALLVTYLNLDIDLLKNLAITKILKS